MVDGAGGGMGLGSAAAAAAGKTFMEPLSWLSHQQNNQLLAHHLMPCSPGCPFPAPPLPALLPALLPSAGARGGRRSHAAPHGRRQRAHLCPWRRGGAVDAAVQAV
jgi:hypothetical protein